MFHRFMNFSWKIYSISMQKASFSVSFYLLRWLYAIYGWLFPKICTNTVIIVKVHFKVHLYYSLFIFSAIFFSSFCFFLSLSLLLYWITCSFAVSSSIHPPCSHHLAPSLHPLNMHFFCWFFIIYHSFRMFLSCFVCHCCCCCPVWINQIFDTKQHMKKKTEKKNEKMLLKALGATKTKTYYHIHGV